MVLDTELKYCDLLKHYENQFVLIKDEVFAGSFTKEVEAYEAGLQTFGNTPFLIKQGLRDEVIERIPGVLNHFSLVNNLSPLRLQGSSA